MSIELFDYESVSQSHDDLNLFATQTTEVKYLKWYRRVKGLFEYYRGKTKNSTLIILAIILLIGDIIYIKQARYCPYESETECFSKFLLKGILQIVISMAEVSFLFSSLFCLTITNIIERKYVLMVVGNFIIVYKLMDHKSDMFVYSYLYSFMLLVMCTIFTLLFLFVYGVIIFGKMALRKKSFVVYVLSLIFLFYSLARLFYTTLDTSPDWRNDLFGGNLKLKGPKDVKYCVIRPPNEDWYNILSGLQDTNRYYDCTKDTYSNSNRNLDVINKYIPQSKQNRYLAFPRLHDIPYTQSRVFQQNYIFNNTLAFNDIENLPNTTEYVLDTEKMQYLQ